MSRDSAERQLNGAKSLFDSLRKWSDLQRLVDEAVPEGVYLECKTQTGVLLGQGTKAQIAETASAMANASGGVILLGVSTTAVKASKLDVVSGLEPIGHVDSLAARVEIELSQLTEPPLIGASVRAIKRARTDAGVVAILVPQSSGDPVRSTVDDRFYFRGSDGDTHAPYEVIRRLFAASDVPDLAVGIHVGLSTRNDDGSFQIPIRVTNRSSALARDVIVNVAIENFENCLAIKAQQFTDLSPLNPGNKLFSARIPNPIHRGLDLKPGDLIVTMAGTRWPRRILEIKITLFADKMRARSYRIRANLKRTGLEVKAVSGPEYLY